MLTFKQIFDCWNKNYISDTTLIEAFENNNIPKSNRLLGHIFYGCGPMDAVDDRGVGWREDIQTFLNEQGIGFANPCNNPVIGSLEEEHNYYDELKRLKELGEWETVIKYAKQIVRADLHLIDISNAVICYLDTDIHSSGTNTELTYAALEKKPVILVCKQGKEAIPNFLWGLGLDHNMFFDNWDQAKDYLCQVAYEQDVASIPAFNRWRFIDYEKVFGV